ncbi:anti-sigma regulatory factor (Ser/Thr protein kinase) [Streptomyces sp. V3I8]|uniref:ATP-binding protein n=1 Tax=Streptomyces sp. V3I8 TaxID=3042279 RepID=UPI00277F0AED|nr:ATP-binding protein [Streptomyces sp. V3I8]MDQ1037806.1 anti-sigma regulatory factor (Ser/Thr protein kinase) [Streptomyces sp. V3I8]
MLTGTTTTEDDHPRRNAERAGQEWTTPEGGSSEPHLCVRQFTSSLRGVRLARRLAVWCMEEWGHPQRSDVSCTVALIVNELAANAVQHGSVPGHGFGLRLGLRLGLDGTVDLIRIEVADAATGKRPPSAPLPASPDAESGRGLLLVDVLSTRWGSSPRHPLGKTVWAEVTTIRDALS